MLILKSVPDLGMTLLSVKKHKETLLCTLIVNSMQRIMCNYTVHSEQLVGLPSAHLGQHSSFSTKI